MGGRKAILVAASVLLTSAFLSPPSTQAQSKVFELTPVASGPLTGTSKKTSDFRLKLRAGSFDPLIEAEPALPAEFTVKEYAAGERGQYIVQYNSEHPNEVADLLKSLGADVYGSFPGAAFRVRMDPAIAAQLRLNQTIRSIVVFQPGYKLDDQVKAVPAGTAIKLAVLLWSAAERDTFIREVASLGAHTQNAGGTSSAIVQLTIDGAQIAPLARRHDVAFIQQAGTPTPVLDQVAPILETAPVWNNGYLGGGETVAIVDTGMDVGHPAFAGRITSTIDYGTPDATTDTYGHGTHVAGIVGGSGAQSSNNNKKGIASEVKFLNQAFVHASATSLTTVLTDAWNSGVRVSNNSWNYTTAPTNKYDEYARELDTFINNNTEWDANQVIYKTTMQANVAAGNDGVIGSPGMAKNIITVGGTYNTKDGSPDQVHSNSGRGPTATSPVDQRTKPDIVAVGWNVVSTRSSHTTNASFSPYLTNASYADVGGTSMAAPQVSAASAIVRQYFKGRNILPSAALVKAALINGATPLPTYALPSTTQGWGRLDLANTLYPSNQGWSYSDGKYVRHKTTVTYQVTVTNSNVPLIATIAWIDQPGDPAASLATVSDLDLTLTSPNGAIFTSSSGQETVEQVRLDMPVTGVWTVEVGGFNVPANYQRFSLCMRGGF